DGSQYVEAAILLVRPGNPAVRRVPIREARIEVDIGHRSATAAPMPDPPAQSLGNLGTSTSQIGGLNERVQAKAHAPGQRYAQDKIHSVGLWLKHPQPSFLGHEHLALDAAVGEHGLDGRNPVGVAVAVEPTHLGPAPSDRPRVIWTGGRIEQRALE